MRHYLKAIGVGVCAGILLTVFRFVFRIDETTFKHICWAMGAAALLGAVLFYVLYVGRYNKRLRAAITHYDAGETDVYMDEVEDMLRTAKGRVIQSTLKIDLSAGYYTKGEYNKAIGILEEMSDEILPGVLKMGYRLNLCLYYFRAGRNGEAMELYRAGEKEFARYRKNKDCGGDIALMDMLAAIEEGRCGEAEEMLAHARQAWTSPRLQKEYRIVGETLEKGKG